MLGVSNMLPQTACEPAKKLTGVSRQSWFHKSWLGNPRTFNAVQLPNYMPGEHILHSGAKWYGLASRALDESCSHCALDPAPAFPLLGCLH